MHTNENYIKSKALEIISKLSDDQIDRTYGSALKDSEGACTISHVKTGKFFPRYTRKIEISDEYAKQIFYRYSLKNINGILRAYSASSIDAVQKSRAEEYLNVYKNIENVYSNKNDDENFDFLVQRAVHSIFSSLDFSKECDINIPHRYLRPIETTTILNIKTLPEIKAKRLTAVSNRIKSYSMKKDV